VLKQSASAMLPASRNAPRRLPALSKSSRMSQKKTTPLDARRLPHLHKPRPKESCKMMTLRLLKFIPLAVVWFLLIVEVSADVATSNECTNPDADASNCAVESEDPKCPSRPHIIRCAAEYLDTNKNNKLDREELEKAIDSLNWLARGVLKVIGSVDVIMRKCDYDGDGAISIDHDMEHNAETCLASCFKRRAFKGAFFPDCKL